MMNDARARLRITPEEYLATVRKLISVDGLDVMRIIHLDPTKWQSEIDRELEQLEARRPNLSNNKEKFAKLVEDAGAGELFEELEQTANELGRLSLPYIIDYFQIYVASRALAQEEHLSFIKLEPGSGKSYIAALIALYMSSQNL